MLHNYGKQTTAQNDGFRRFNRKTAVHYHIMQKMICHASSETLQK